MTPNTTEETVVQPESRQLGKLIDWLVAACLAFGGFVFGVLGVVFYSAADRTWIADLVADGRLQSTELTDAQLIDVTVGLLWWGGIGLAVTGLLLVVAGVAFLVLRTRARRRREAEGVYAPDTTAMALAGAVVTIVTSFVPLSPILGGLVAGYLRGGSKGEGARVGAYAGVVATLPLALVLLFVGGGFAIVAGEVAIAGPVTAFVVGAIVLSVLVTAVYMAALSALGGYFGVSLSKDRDPVAPEEDVAV
jgi:MFS family permease